MTAEEFYEEFKAALVYLGLRWGDKHLACMCVRDGCVVITYGKKSASIEI